MFGFLEEKKSDSEKFTKQRDVTKECKRGYNNEIIHYLLNTQIFTNRESNIAYATNSISLPGIDPKQAEEKIIEIFGDTSQVYAFSILNTWVPNGNSGSEIEQYQSNLLTGNFGLERTMRVFPGQDDGTPELSKRVEEDYLTCDGTHIINVRSEPTLSLEQKVDKVLKAHKNNINGYDILQDPGLLNKFYEIYKNLPSYVDQAPIRL